MDSKRFLTTAVFVLVLGVALLGTAGSASAQTGDMTSGSTTTGTTLYGTTGSTTGTTDATTPGVPNTGQGGNATANAFVLLGSALVAVLGAGYYFRHTTALR
jgi:hypothetical protein